MKFRKNDCPPVMPTAPPDAPLPPLPMVEVGPFVGKPRCVKCGSRCVTWAYMGGYHDGCATGVHVGWPYYSIYGDVAEYNRQSARAVQRRNTVPEHHDLTCDRCRYSWAVGLATVGAVS